MPAHLPLAFFNFGGGEMLIIAIVALLLFGPRLPTVMRGLGKGISEFKKGIHETEEHIRRELDRPSEPEQRIDHRPDQAASQPTNQTANQTINQTTDQKPGDQHPPQA